MKEISPKQAEKLRKIFDRKKIDDYAKKELGFDLVGFSPAKIEDVHLKAFEEWLKNGLNADMQYMEKIKQRSDLCELLPGAKTVIVLAMNYFHENGELSPGHGRVARYAYGRDYHKIIGKKLKKLQKFIEEEVGGDTKAYVDTGPVLERALAQQAGLGRIGKNSLLITKEFGSWVFLSEVITTLGLLTENDDKKDAWSNPEHPSFNVCGGCTNCIRSCPTGAIIAPGVVDSRLCISYLTIENKGNIPKKLQKTLEKVKTLYGCDICQEVCPHNLKRSQSAGCTELKDPKIAGEQLDLQEIKKMTTDQQYLETFAGSPLMRAKLSGLKRNAEALENVEGK